MYGDNTTSNVPKDSFSEDNRKFSPAIPRPRPTLGAMASASSLSSSSFRFGNTEADSTTNSNKNYSDDSDIPWGDRKPAAKVFPFSDYGNDYQHFQMEDIDDDDDDDDYAMDLEDYDDPDMDLVEYPSKEKFESSIATGSDEEFELNTPTKDGVLLPRNSPSQRIIKRLASSSSVVAKPSPSPDKKGEATLKTDHSSHTDDEENGRCDCREDDDGHDDGHDDSSALLAAKNGPRTTKTTVFGDGTAISNRELLWAASIFFLVVGISVLTAALVLIKGQSSSILDANSEGLIPSTPSASPPFGEPPTPPPVVVVPRLSVQNEWKLVYAAIRDNPLTQSLLVSGDGEEVLPADPTFYEGLVEGMVFSEDHRDWIPAVMPLSDDNDDLVNLYGMTTTDQQQIAGNNNGNSINTNNHSGGQHIGMPPSAAKKNPMTPNQKATAWLLYHDRRKDPNESVWRWALASIYFKMGGHGWTIFRRDQGADRSSPKWFTNAPLCDWERLEGCSGYFKDKGNDNRNPKAQTHLHHAEQHHELPVDLDFDDSNLSGSIATEFSLLRLYNTGSDDEDTVLRAITLTDNRLTGRIPGRVFEFLFPSLGKLYLDGNELTGTIPYELGGLDALYVQNNALTGDWPEEFCADGENPAGSESENGLTVVDDFGMDCDAIECSCCGILQCYY